MNRKSVPSGHTLLGPGLALAAFLGGLAYGLSPRASATLASNERALARSSEFVDYSSDGAPDDAGPFPVAPPRFRALGPGCPPDAGGQAAGPALGVLVASLDLTARQRRCTRSVLDADRDAIRALFDSAGIQPGFPPSPEQMAAIHGKLHQEQVASHAHIVKLLTAAQAARLAAAETMLCVAEPAAFGPLPPPGMPT